MSNQAQKQMSAAMGGSQVSVYRDIEKGNYASIKAAISFDEEECKIVFNNIENYIIRPYLRRLFEVGVQQGRVSLAKANLISEESNLRDQETDYLRVVGIVAENLSAPQSPSSLIPETVEEAINRIMPDVKEDNSGSPNKRGTAIFLICKYYLERSVVEWKR